MRSDESPNIQKCRCQNCFLCCYTAIRRYRMYCRSYPLLRISGIQSNPYSFRTQVGCERIFSKLRYIKSRLKNQLSEDRLNSLLLMCVERDVLLRISNHTIIDELAKINAEMQRLLLYK